MLYNFGEWELDIDLYELRRAGEPVRLEPLVFDVFVYLVLNRDRVISKQELMNHVWPDQFIGDSALERCIMAARKAVGDSGGRQHVIKTFHRRGYRFIAPVTERQPGDPPPVQQVSSISSLGDPPVLSPNKASQLNNNPSLGSIESTGNRTSDQLAVPEEASPHERQQVTVLSGSLICSDALYSQDEKSTLLQGCFERATQQVQAYSGLMAECTADSFLALFGATEPCDDHALRAVRVALELREQLDEECQKLGLAPDGLRVHMGVHTGDIVGKQFGEETRVMYMAVGNMMQFAANLQACTEPGNILFSRATHQFVQAEVCAEVAGLIAVNGVDVPVAAYRLHGLRSSKPISARI